MAFQQEGFEYKNLYQENNYLQDILRSYVSDFGGDTIHSDLLQFSPQTSSEILHQMWRAENNPPRHIPYDAWGMKNDEIIMDTSWSFMHGKSAMEGLVALAYERKNQEYSRLHQFLKLFLFHPSSAFYTCPLAMTDGAARVLETTGEGQYTDVFSHLVSRNPNYFWTAGQWMTEKAGGSDVSRSETYADMNGTSYRLYGTKWFTSAITSEVAMALAQTQIEGKSKLSLFLVPIRNPEGKLNQIEVLRLKDKLGTKAMPTAELKLNGVESFLIGQLGEGVKNITTILNISRLYNSICASATAYRLHSLARDYSIKRQAFGKKLKDHVLHQNTLTETLLWTLASTQMVMGLSVLLGKSENQKVTETEDALLRVMTPVAKAWTAKRSMFVVSELVESFGGAGYIEDTHLPRFLRDTQVFSIWEGTTNIMSLDMLRALSKPETLKAFFAELFKMFDDIEELGLSCFEAMKKNAVEIEQWLIANIQIKGLVEKKARYLLFEFGDLYALLLLGRMAKKTQSQRDFNIVEQYSSMIAFSNQNSILSSGDKLQILDF